MDDSRAKFISEVETDQEIIGVRKPFELRRTNERRYIRLEISAPVDYSMLKNSKGMINTLDDEPVYHSSILNLSAGGVLVVCDHPIEEGAVVLMNMTLQGVELINKVLGLVKRADGDDGDWLIGIEFLTRENLTDHFSKGEMDLIPEEATSFDEQIRNVLNKYVYKKKSGASSR